MKFQKYMNHCSCCIINNSQQRLATSSNDWKDYSVFPIYNFQSFHSRLQSFKYISQGKSKKLKLSSCPWKTAYQWFQSTIFYFLEKKKNSYFQLWNARRIWSQRDITAIWHYLHIVIPSHKAHSCLKEKWYTWIKVLSVSYLQDEGSISDLPTQKTISLRTI